MLLRDLLLRVWRLLKEWILPIWKWLLHHITGRSEIERICLSTRLSPLERALRLGTFPHFFHIPHRPIPTPNTHVLHTV